MARIARRIAILLLLPALGCIAGLAYMSSVSSDSRIPWQTLGSPPEVPDEFLSTLGTIVVGSPSGRAYKFEGCDPLCWSELPSVPTKEIPLAYNLCGTAQPPPLDGVIVSTSECTPWGLGYQYRAFAVTRDGSVHYWLKQFGGEFDFGLLVFPVGGAAALMVLAILILAYLYFVDLLHYLETRSRRHPPEDPTHS